MSKQGAKTAVVAIATATVVVLSIYLTYKQRRMSNAPVRWAPPSTPDPAVAEPADGRRVPPRIGELRKGIHGLIGNLADLQKRVTGEGEQVVARYKLGKQGRRLPDIDLTSEAPEPALPASPQGRP